MKTCKPMTPAAPITKGVEDKFYYVISDACVRCGKCRSACPVGAIRLGEGHMVIDKAKCIDCGTCSAVCPTGAAQRAPYVRESISLENMDWSRCYFNPGCAINLYKSDVAEKLLAMLQTHRPAIQSHNICCRHDPGLPAGSVIINNCAGCDRRFRSLYEGIETISLWEVLDSMEGLELPNYGGMKMSVHDSCGYRHKPQVHAAIRSLLKKMNIEVVEAPFHGCQSICCGDNFYCQVSDEKVEQRIQMRGDMFPCEDVVTYCIGCDHALAALGKRARYLPDLLCGIAPTPYSDSIHDYHSKLNTYIEAH